ncbi:MAG: DNA-binding NtrC family response regulator [Candidatus Krumholzibacteriia bacterium]|jgi:DNA-binding NtrC family response regulator
MKPVILVIDDEEAIRLFLEATLEDRSFVVQTAGTGNEAMTLAKETVPDLVLLDLMLPDMTGMQVLEELKKLYPHLPVVMITGYSKTDAAVQAMKLDAFDFVNKPIQLAKLLSVIEAALAATVEVRESFRLRTQSDLFSSSDDIVPSQSPAMLKIYEMVRRISNGSATTVLIEGESGVGKDVVANLIHRTSPRNASPFLDLNCAALPEQLLESELFGHEKGAFTDAVQQKMGLLELAHSGTLFLDEIGEMSMSIQVKLLRVLEKMSFRRVGGLADITVDVRIVAATNRRLASLVKAGLFREDLYYRLNVVQLQVPPLRSRPEDVVPLANHYLTIYNERFGKGFTGLDVSAKQVLAEYSWPGNIRELRNLIERTVLLEDGNILTSGHLHLEPVDHESRELPTILADVLESPLTGDGVKLENLVEAFEAALMRKAYEAANGNQTRAAGLLGLNRDKFRYRLKQYGIKEA